MSYKIPHLQSVSVVSGSDFSMNSLSFEQADFLMHCIDNFCAEGTPNFTSPSGEVMLTYAEIESLWNRIQDAKLANVNRI